MRALHNSTFQDSSNFIIKNNIPYFYYPNDKSYCGKLKHNLALDTLFELELDQKYNVACVKNQCKEQEKQESIDFIYKRKNNISSFKDDDSEYNIKKQYKGKKGIKKKGHFKVKTKEFHIIVTPKKKRQHRERKRHHKRQEGYIYKICFRNDCELTLQEEEEEEEEENDTNDDVVYDYDFNDDFYLFQIS
jgi:hypothetical protein